MEDGDYETQDVENWIKANRTSAKETSATLGATVSADVAQKLYSATRTLCSA